jgi:hypothetical protein
VLRTRGTEDATIRVFLTLVSALDRARDADRLWKNAAEAVSINPWIIDPASVACRPLLDLMDALRTGGVSQRHTIDAAAWRTISEALLRPELAPAIHRAVFLGRGDVAELRRELEATTRARTRLFPMLGGPKVGPMWVRMMAEPGKAVITGFEGLEVAVDVQVKKVTEYLGMTATGSLSVEASRSLIEEAWREQVRLYGAVGPPAVTGTAAALDPAIWFFGKWGCTFCERAHRRLPIAPVCSTCQLAVPSS